MMQEAAWKGMISEEEGLKKTEECLKMKEEEEVLKRRKADGSGYYS